METINLLKPHKIAFEIIGIWSLQRNILSCLHITFAFYFITLGFIATLFISILFVGSMKQAVDNLIVSSSTVLALIKGIIFYYKHPKHVEIYEVIGQLDRDIDLYSPAEVAIMKRVNKFASILFHAYGICYIIAWFVLAIQSVFESDEKVFWSSTALYPGAIGQNRIIYWIVFVFQAFANFVLVILVFICDTYGIIVTMILSSNMDILSTRLRNLGSIKANIGKIREESKSAESIDQSIALKKCAEKYQTFIR